MAKGRTILPEVTIVSKKKKSKPAKVDSMMVGNTKRSLKDISKAVVAANKSGTAKQYVKGVDSLNPYKSTRQLASKGSTSDVVNKIIDSTKKTKEQLLASGKKRK